MPYCAVKGCHNSSDEHNKHSNITFHGNSLDITGQGRICRCPCLDDEEVEDEEPEEEAAAPEAEVTEEEDAEEDDRCDHRPPFSREIIPPNFYRSRTACPLRVACYPPKPQPPCEAEAEAAAEAEEEEDGEKRIPGRHADGGNPCATCPVWRPKRTMPPLVKPTHKTRCYEAHEDRQPKKTKCDPY